MKVRTSNRTNYLPGYRSDQQPPNLHTAVLTAMTKKRVRYADKENSSSNGSYRRPTLDDFTVITPHPYGVEPAGNSLLAGGTSCRQESLRWLSDSLWQHVFSFCDGPTLGGGVVIACREWYVAGHQPELWRDLVLRLYEGRTLAEMPTSGSWKDTYAQSVDSSFIGVHHSPLRLQGVFSDELHRTHTCRSFRIPEVWYDPSNGSVDRVKDMNPEVFFAEYEEKNVPVVMCGSAKSWTAVERWKSVSYLERHTKGRSFRATSGAAPLPANFELPAYVSYCRSDNLEEAPLYLFDRTALGGGQLRDDFFPDLQRTCPNFDPCRVRENSHDLFQLLGGEKRPDHTWLIVGPKRSGSSFHIDPNATHAWNAAIVGRKRWIFYPPGVTPPGVHPSPDGDHVTMPISLGEWIINFWAEHLRRCRTAPESERPIECTAKEGDVVFVPHGWWHMVINLDDFNVAITHNYVARSNLSNVLRFLVRKVDQISGCRDRTESIKPERLHQEFCTKLREDYPMWLTEATIVADRQWTCRAWNDSLAEDGKDKTGSGKSTVADVRTKQETKRPKTILSEAIRADDKADFSFSFF